MNSLCPNKTSDVKEEGMDTMRYMSESDVKKKYVLGMDICLKAM
jgi:hypothetical protein